MSKKKSNIARLPVAPRREWKAAKVDLMRSDWPTVTRPPDADIKYGLRVLRSRARHEAQNNDHARAFLREVKSNVIGPKGVRLQSKASQANGKPDERARRAIEDAWCEWGEVGSCDVTGRLGWVDVQHQCAETIARDGEAIYRIVDGEFNAYGLALQALDPETLDTEYSEALPNGNVVIMGVELDELNRPIAYHFTKEDRLHLAYKSIGGRRRARTRMRVPAESILHMYLPEWVAQTRGVPWMATALRRMTDLNGYDESAVVAARAGASKMGFFKQSEDAPAPYGEDGQPSGLLGDMESAEGQLYSEFDPGSMGLLPPGVEFQGWDPRYPHSEHGSFSKAVLRGIAAGLGGVNYNTLNSDGEGVNFSTMRHFALVDRAVWMMLQEWLIRTFHTRVYRAWLSNALQSGELRDPRGRPLQTNREREFRRVYWQPRRWAWVDPKKDAETATIEVEQRIRSLGSVIRERGEDPEEVWREIQRERELLAEMGISPQEAMAAALPDTDEPEDLDDE